MKKALFVNKQGIFEVSYPNHLKDVMSAVIPHLSVKKVKLTNGSTFKQVSVSEFARSK